MASENYRAPSVAQSAELAEQQGVELPPLPEPRDMGYTTDSVMRTYTMTGYTSEQMQDYGRFALAARQPGAQEAVAVVGPDFTLLWVGSGPISPIVERHGLKRGSLLYAAPPAQGIDLGQQQDAARWRWVREQNGVTVSVEEADDDGDMTFVSGHTPEELDAAIDGQRDAASRVGNG